MKLIETYMVVALGIIEGMVLIVSVYVLLEYVQECRKRGVKPTKEGLYKFKKLWK